MNPLIVRIAGVRGDYGVFVVEIKEGVAYVAHVIKLNCATRKEAEAAARKYQAEPRNFTLIPFDKELS